MELEWLNQPDSHVWQWIGLVATILGLMAAIWAALRAAGAETQAEKARDEAVRLGNVLHLSDLREDMRELEAMLAREEFAGLSAKAGTIRGRIERFKQQQSTYGVSTDETAQALDMAKRQLDIISKVAAPDWRGKPENRPSRIQKAVNNADEALNKAFGIQHASIKSKRSQP